MGVGPSLERIAAIRQSIDVGGERALGANPRPRDHRPECREDAPTAVRERKQRTEPSSLIDVDVFVIVHQPASPGCGLTRRGISSASDHVSDRHGISPPHRPALAVDETILATTPRVQISGSTTTQAPKVTESMHHQSRRRHRQRPGGIEHEGESASPCGSVIDLGPSRNETVAASDEGAERGGSDESAGAGPQDRAECSQCRTLAEAR